MVLRQIESFPLKPECPAQCHQYDDIIFTRCHHAGDGAEPFPLPEVSLPTPRQ